MPQLCEVKLSWINCLWVVNGKSKTEKKHRNEIAEEKFWIICGKCWRSESLRRKCNFELFCDRRSYRFWLLSDVCNWRVLRGRSERFWCTFRWKSSIIITRTPCSSMCITRYRSTTIIRMCTWSIPNLMTNMISVTITSRTEERWIRLGQRPWVTTTITITLSDICVNDRRASKNSSTTWWSAGRDETILIRLQMSIWRR